MCVSQRILVISSLPSAKLLLRERIKEERIRQRRELLLEYAVDASFSGLALDWLQANHGLIAFGNNDFLTGLGTRDELRQVGLRLMNCHSRHGSTVKWT